MPLYLIFLFIFDFSGKINCVQHQSKRFEDLKPQLLSEKELKDPKMVFQQFFEIDHLTGWKKTLWQIFEDLTKKQYNHKPGSKEYDDTLYDFEKLEKMIEAAWLRRN
jgi:hypothetical protein